MSERPPNSLLQKIADTSYKAVSPPTIDGWTLIFSTPTLRIYLRGNQIIVGIRGTQPTDTQDLQADASIALGMLRNSARFNKDLQTLQQVQLEYPASQYHYYGVGHSLGGAILDLFLNMGLIKSGLSYNPAVQPGDFDKENNNKRIYSSDDPLYRLMGRHTKGAEVRNIPKTPWQKLIEKIPYVGKIFGSYQAHKLDNFVGGAIYREKFYRQYKVPKQGYSLSELSHISHIPLDTLQEVYNRGIGAYKTNPTSVRMKGTFEKNVKAPMSKKLSKEQWAMARVYSFIMGNKKHDNDLRQKGSGKSKFMTQLSEVGISPSEYLKQAKARAKANGYNPDDLDFADDDIHKLSMKNEKGQMRKFGRVGYNDFLLWSFLEKNKKVPEGTAKSKQNRFVKSHSKIKGDWKDDDYSPNWLSIRILW